jgi:hypothetical protein
LRCVIIEDIAEVSASNDALLKFYETRAEVAGSFVLKIDSNGSSKLFRKTPAVLNISKTEDES